MYAYARELGTEVIFFFVSLVVLGNFIMLNLFLAILLKNFEVKEQDPEKSMSLSIRKSKATYLIS
jgi:hypothetical protein